MDKSGRTTPRRPILRLCCINLVFRYAFELLELYQEYQIKVYLSSLLVVDVRAGNMNLS